MSGEGKDAHRDEEPGCVTSVLAATLGGLALALLVTSIAYQLWWDLSFISKLLGW